jgi:hypothetical protein
MQALPLRRECGTRGEREQGAVLAGSGAAEAIELENWGWWWSRASSGVASFVWTKFKVRNYTCDHDYARARQGLVGRVQDDLKAWSTWETSSKALKKPCKPLAGSVQAFTALAGVTRP